MTHHAQIVIIGAGIVGCSTAYYLAKYGAKDVIVIDKGDLDENDGSTSHAPGGVNPLSLNTSMCQLAQQSVDLYESLPRWKPNRKPLHMVGGIDVARTEERMHEVRRLHTASKGFGIESHIVPASEIEDYFPLIDSKQFVGALYTPRKPVISGAHASGALRDEAVRMSDGGVRFVGNTKAIDFVIENNRCSGVKTNNPEMPLISCEKVLLCTNIWTPAVTERVGVTIPLLSAEHQYLHTNPIPELAHCADLNDADKEIIYPSVRDLDGGLYYRHWWNCLGMGSYHHKPIMVQPRDLGKPAEHPFTEEDWTEAYGMAKASIPALRNATFKSKFNGMFSFSVDGLPILGETSVDGFWVAAAVWITNGGGVGRAMAQWLLTGETEVDMRGLNVNRFLPYQLTDRYIQISCTKSYAEVHDATHPAQPTSKPRNVRHSLFYQRHVESSAEFINSAGLEMPYWYEENSRLLEKYEDRVPARSGWGARYWSRIQGAEHLAVRDSVGLFDLSSLGVIDLAGPDACRFIDYATTNRMDMPIGNVQYTLLCTQSGGIKRDLAAARMADDHYRMFTGQGTLPQELDWLQRLARDKFDVRVSDGSAQHATLGLMGPNARRVLEKVTPNDVSNEAFPFYTWQKIEIGMAEVFAMRISYVGELGYELYVSPDQALAVRDLLWEAGREFDIIGAGVGAMRSMRFEKGYRLFGADIYTEHNPYEAGMGWMVKLKKGDFVGRNALQKIRADVRENGFSRRLVTLLIDDPNAVVMGNEPVYDGDKVIGQITSGNYGYSVGKYVAFGYVPPAYASAGTTLAVEFMNKRFAATVGADAQFDPKNERMKA